MTNNAPYILAHAYASLEASPPIAVGSTNVKYPMPVDGTSNLAHPRREMRYDLTRRASHPGFAAVRSPRLVGPVDEWSMEGPSVDAVPEYLHFGKAAVNAGAPDYDIYENDTGLPVQLVTHVEFNELGKVWDLHPSYATKLKTSIKDGMLWSELSGIAGGITAGNKLTTAPSAVFGNNSPTTGMNHVYNAASKLNMITWNSIGLEAFFVSFEWESESKIDIHEYEHTTALGLVNRNERDISEITMSIVVENNAVLRNLFDDNDASTNSDLVVTFARAGTKVTPTDFKRYTFYDVYLKYFNQEPVVWKSMDGGGTGVRADLVFTPPTLHASGYGVDSTRILVTEDQATANAAATYQL